VALEVAMPAVAGVWAEVVRECVLDALVDLKQHGATGRQMGRCLIEHPLYQPGSPLGREEGVVRLGKHFRRPRRPCKRSPRIRACPL